MNNLLKHSMLALAMATTASTVAHARVGDHHNPPPTPPRQPGHDPRQAPEVDPNLAIGGFTLLAGALTVIRARRNR